MTGWLWLAALGPASLAAVGAYASFNRDAPLLRVLRLSSFASLLALACAVGEAIAVALHGPLRTPLAGFGGVGFSLYADGLSATMVCLVAFVGVIVARYSRTYLDGDSRQKIFFARLCFTLSAVLSLVISGNLFALALAWALTSVGLNSLLLFYPDRPAALLAARKKFVASRLGDFCLIAAAALIYQRFGTLEYGEIFARAAGVEALDAICLLLVAAALLKSAQAPTHGWLLEVMETPTPVSALLHAGIINAGGFLALRFSGLIAHSLPALDTLALVGGFTALFGSVVMLTQTSVKVSLAYSTIAQMGFMMLECGLGAFPAALLHIVAHSLYKAHAFLSSGSVIDIARASWSPSPGGKPHPWRQLIAIAFVLAVAFVLGRLFGATLEAQPGVFALGVVLLLGLTHLIASGIDERPNAYVVLHTLLRASLVGLVYFALQLQMERLLSETLPAAQALRGPFELMIVGLVVLSFAFVTFLQGLVQSLPDSPKWHALYVHVANGFYLNTLANRLVLRFWPLPKPAVSGLREA